MAHVIEIPDPLFAALEAAAGRGVVLALLTNSHGGGMWLS